jgi:predicted ester cyclase
MTPNAAKQIARRVLEEVLNGRNLPRASEVLLDRDGVDRCRSLLEASSDLRVEILDLVSDGRKVAIRARYAGTDTGGVFPGTQPTGMPFDLEGIHVAEVRDDGRFAQFEGIVDLRAAMDQLRLVPSMTG